MTDEDRYGRRLGKGFEAIRALSRLPNQEDEFSERCARYVFRLLTKELDLEAFAKDAAPICIGTQSLFASDDPLERLRKMSVDSVASEHAFRSLQAARQSSGGLAEMLDGLAGLSAQSLGALLSLQRDYRDDRDCQRAFAAQETEIMRKLASMLKARCGLGKIAPMAPRADTAGILEFVVVKE